MLSAVVESVCQDPFLNGQIRDVVVVLMMMATQPASLGMPFARGDCGAASNFHDG